MGGGSIRVSHGRNIRIIENLSFSMMEESEESPFLRFVNTRSPIKPIKAYHTIHGSHRETKYS